MRRVVIGLVGLLWVVCATGTPVEEHADYVDEAETAVVAEDPGTASEAAPSTSEVVSEDEAGSPWLGTNAQAGGVINTGNTQSQNYNAAVNLKYTYKKWLFTEGTTYQRISSQDGVTADKFYTQGQANYNLSDHNFVYTQANYTRDLFSGFTYVVNVTIGYGRRIDLGLEKVTLDLFAGPGMRFDEEEDSSDKREDASLQLGGTISWNITEMTDIQEQVQTTLARDNTHSFSKSSITTDLTDHTSFAVEYLISNDSRPAAGKKNINTTTTVNFIYNF